MNLKLGWISWIWLSKSIADPFIRSDPNRTNERFRLDWIYFWNTHFSLLWAIQCNKCFFITKHFLRQFSFSFEWKRLLSSQISMDEKSVVNFSSSGNSINHSVKWIFWANVYLTNLLRLSIIINDEGFDELIKLKWCCMCRFENRRPTIDAYVPHWWPLILEMLHRLSRYSNSFMLIVQIYSINIAEQTNRRLFPRMQSGLTTLYYQHH